MPYLPGPILMAYQLIVCRSRSASGCADFRNSSTSFSLPGLASSWAHMETLLIGVFSSPSDAGTKRLILRQLPKERGRSSKASERQQNRPKEFASCCISDAYASTYRVFVREREMIRLAVCLRPLTARAKFDR